MATKISVINFKGGVGKTTLAFHLATYLANSDFENKRVLIIDVDHQSSLSIVILGEKAWESCVKAAHTSNHIFEPFCNPDVTRGGSEIIFKNPIQHRRTSHQSYPGLDVVPAQFELDDTEIDLASTTIGGATRSEWTKRTLLATWLDSVDANKNYEYIIFDCPPATKLVSQNALAASDYFVIPVIPDEMSSRGVTHFRELVKEKVDAKLERLRKEANISDDRTPASYSPTTKLAGIVPFMAKTAGRAYSGMTDIHTIQLNALKRKWKGELLGTVKSYTGIPESINVGLPVWDRLGERNVTPYLVGMMKSVCKEIVDRTR